MSSIQHFKRESINKDNACFSAIRAVIETAFYGNNVTKVTSLETAYTLAKNAPGTIVTDLPVSHTEELGLPEDAKILVNNDGAVVGRTAAARRIIGQDGVDEAKYCKILQEAVFTSGRKQFYKGSIFVGLAPEFTMQAHLMLPQEYSSNLYTYLLNFQIANDHTFFYAASKEIPEGDLYLFCDPDWSHPDFPDGLVVIDHLHNCAAVLGLRYFGELKKATLTLAWACAHRNGFIACHGGMKQYVLPEHKYTMAAFGLSGSGKSTITLASHNNQHMINVLHDDAFVICKNKGSSTALEPAYFDKTQDYPLVSDQVKYIVTAQNVGVTLDNHNQRVLLTEDVRNGNGRSIKSRYVTKNRVDHLVEKVDAVFWIMKDDSFPPVIKVNDPELAAVLGATLATKRSTAENVIGDSSKDKLVIEPFANPFRCYPLAEDYKDFLELFKNQQTDCYLLNTGFFQGKKVTPSHTLTSIEKIVEKNVECQTFGPLKEMTYLPIEGLLPDFTDLAYITKLMKRIETRLAFVQSRKHVNNGYDRLPNNAERLLLRMLDDLHTYKESLIN
ncbi:phosphoenolpyruvate carboxykinase [Enterococcus florum]|uniref:phosphoenolpyruvate carboxykinase (ATP) n=1 Tax=Enterococcus florum TaxID=2480627 RepID=A0A4P5PDP7_9ENTE|nr:phosphoenolpyruvate carboxykinase (ATP) [Enterococcus florum]GCF93702.1 phosphoenolpyruvate carboxykinase [Enterococcus florum]